MRKQSAEKIARDHWSYVGKLLEDEIPEDQSYSKREYIEGIGKHYQAALIHGIKHGSVWERQRGKN